MRDTMLDVPRGAYNVVLCRHVLEHLEDPLTSLHMMADLLAPGGVLILVLPKEDHWMPGNLRPDTNQHLYCWNPRTIANLLWRASLEPLSIEYRYPFGAHRLLPLRRISPALYHTVRRAGSVLGRNGEMVVRASLGTPGRNTSDRRST